ncbi:MAG: tRNA lysidine(34) synthetase TilS [Bacteroidota bacterium]
MIGKFKSFVAEKQLFTANDKILLAVSGGMDSMAMAELFSKAGIDFALVHCNYQLRGEESDADEALVKETASRYKVNFYSQTFNTEKIADESGESIQMAARRLRYDFFNEIADKHNYHYVATAHHLDDQTETFFINLLRGCGIAGLHGIKVQQGKLIRPMMFAHRHEIEEYVKQNNIAYRDDASNQSLKYMRNRVRHQIIPLFREMNPSFEQEMGRNIQRLADAEEIYKQHIQLKINESIKADAEIITISIERLKELHPIQTYLFEFIAQYGFNQADIGRIVDALDGTSGKKFISASHQLIIDRKEIVISALADIPDMKEEFLIKQDDSVLSEPIAMSISVHKAVEYTIPPEKNTASLDYGKLHFPLKLRHWKEGDSFFPLGMKNKKKLSDFFIDEKFSILKKEKTWVLCSGQDIVWIVGERIDDRYKVAGETSMVYSLKF